MGAPSSAVGRLEDVFVVVRQCWGVLLAIMLIAVAMIVVMPPGLPYDEPAHWANVTFLLDHGRMPRIGEPGSSYEAQMGPVAYVLYAVVAAPFHLGGSDEAAFYAARALGAVQLVALAVAIGMVARRLLPASPSVAMVVTAAVGLNPMLLAVSTSVQNDTLALLLGTSALLVVVTDSPLTMRRSLIGGALVGLAVLTKLTAWPFAVAIAAWLLWRRRARDLVVVVSTAALVAGWWFVRNAVLYGDPTGRSAVEAAGYDFPPRGAGDMASVAQSAIADLWLPTEYVRNSVQSPPLVDALVIGITVVALAGIAALWWIPRVAHARRGRDRARLALVVLAVALLAVGAWLATVTMVQAVSFRAAYGALVLVYGGFAALAFVAPRRTGAVLLAPLAVVTAWFVWSVAHLADVGVLLEW
ncbi:glycosyltransferase 87 family protein [Demequina sp. NBRC 110053]|uniref:glycosyltransferase 87 family protein n=1 Tax=Demequina sp. NBRC 110053 TaxID=1570342 RepID=UPI000A0745E3|nr:glycosyltransferase 87 family protein [Demequina sp. NBRC 110053]